APGHATFTYPATNGQSVDTSRPFAWTTVPGALAYYLYVGTSQGAKDLVNTGEFQRTSYTMPTLPTGVTLWARIYTKNNATPAWSYAEVSFTVPAPTPPPLAFTVGATSASPGSAVSGQALVITTAVTASAAASGINVDLEIYDAAGAQIAQQISD